MYKIVKRSLSLLFALCLIISAVSVVSAAEADVLSVMVETVNAKAGDTVDVDINVTANPGVTVVRLYVDYDENALTLLGAEDGGILNEAMFSDELSSPYCLAWFDALSTENVTATGAIATLRFKVNADAVEGAYNVSVYTDSDNDILNADLVPVQLEAVAGSVNVEASAEDAILGDADGNDSVTASDAVYLMYHTLYGAEQYPLNQECDFDGDGDVDSDDAVYLLYHTLFGEVYPLH